jgi:hypothetical protein
VRPSPSWCNRARRILAAHVERLGDTLQAITERLRETVAQTVSNNLASALREAVHALFIESRPGRAVPSPCPPSPYPARPTWGEPDPFDRDEDDPDLPADDWSGTSLRGWREVECEKPASNTPGSQQTGVRWHRALAVGCQAAAWWLRRQVGRWAALAALGIGLFAAGAALTAGAGLAESALGLLTLADAVQPGSQGSSFVDTR